MTYSSKYQLINCWFNFNESTENVKLLSFIPYQPYNTYYFCNVKQSPKDTLKCNLNKNKLFDLD